MVSGGRSNLSDAADSQMRTNNLIRFSSSLALIRFGEEECFLKFILNVQEGLLRIFLN